ncbi:MAG: hypothetical protein MUF34_03225 [Polyangiaceae bacterium]|nr:hypothetical protein [Polyangiaceae bacterium]
MGERRYASGLALCRLARPARLFGLAPAALAAFAVFASACSSPRPPPPGTDACLADPRAGVGLTDWTTRADAVVVGRVDVDVTPKGRVPIVRVTEQWTGHPVENPFSVQALSHEQELIPGGTWVLFLRRQAPGSYSRLAETASRPDFEVRQGKVLGGSLDVVKERVSEAVHVGEEVERELKRLEFGAPASRAFRLDYRVLQGDASSRWVYTDGAVVRCGRGGPEERRPLPPDEQRALAGALRGSRFWATLPSFQGESSPGERFHSLAIEIAGAVFTFDEPASRLDRVPVLRVAGARLVVGDAAPGR